MLKHKEVTETPEMLKLKPTYKGFISSGYKVWCLAAASRSYLGAGAKSSMQNGFLDARASISTEHLRPGELHKQLSGEGNSRAGFCCSTSSRAEEQPVPGSHLPSRTINVQTLCHKKSRRFYFHLPTKRKGRALVSSFAYLHY